MAALKSPRAKAAAAGNPAAALLPETPDDLDILAPEREIEIGGEKVTVREITFGEQLKHGAALKLLADTLLPALKSDNEDILTAVMDALAAHYAATIPLFSLSIGKSAEWIEALKGEDGEALAMTWWSVNRGFFTRRLVRPIFFHLARNRLPGSPPAGGASSLPSSATATPEAN